MQSLNGSVPGSSPLMRGKHFESKRLPYAGGLIPAHTGKTSSSSCITGLSPAQPHSHGENKQLLVAAASQRGSTPLTRGKQAASRGCCVAARLIPTHAGKTASAPADRADQQAHPRPRGENFLSMSSGVSSTGSSPLTRGKLRDQIRPVLRDRLIPAHAGKTIPRLGAGNHGGAHPRLHGENVREGAAGAPVGGSSPPTRGKPLIP